MKLHFAKKVVFFSVAILQLLLCNTVQAAPVLDLQQQGSDGLRVDLRAHWHTAMVANKSAPSQPLDAQAVWALPDSQFKPGNAAPVMVRDGERFVGRLAVKVAASPNNLLLELPMPRLNLAHASYRYGGGAWTQVSAGDQVPMAKWPMVNRHPVFVIPSRAGELQVVLEIPLVGLFPSPVLLVGDPVFRAAQTARNLQSGAALGLSFVTLLFCIGAAAILRRFAFVAVGVYAISIFLVTAGQGGIFGMYVGTGTSWFNDYVKYVTGIIFGATVPWTISVVTAQKHYARFVAHIANFWLAGSLTAMVVMLFTVQRQTQWDLLAPFLVASLLFGVAIGFASALRGQLHGFLSLAAALLLCAGIFAPIAAYWGYLDGTFSFSVSAVCFFMSTTLLLLAVLLQYRHGNRVIARAQRSPGRDALTGLLNREQFEKKLARLVKLGGGAKPRTSTALFMYIAVSDRDTLEQRFGGEGFESGMVQMAAALSSSISVVDTVARISTNAFGVLVEMQSEKMPLEKAPLDNMPFESKHGNALAQKIISRIMAVASHSSPMAQTARIALAWVPLDGKLLGNLELGAKQILRKLADGKRVGWVSDGATGNAHAPRAGSSVSATDHSPDLKNRSETLHSLINQIEDTMHREGNAAPGKQI